jgi:uncharacterized protein YydD (DUF2326 family)
LVEIRTNHEKMNSSQEQVIAMMHAWAKEIESLVKRETACQGVTEACLESKEPASVETEFIAVYEEVPKEETTVETFGALKKRYGDWHLAVGHC